MNTKRNLLATVLSVLAVGCAWAAAGISGNAAFAVIADHEATQILGGAGWDCNIPQSQEKYRPCGDTEDDCSYWVYTYETWQCGRAVSGECDDSGLVIGFCWGGCVWYPEIGVCGRDGTYWEVPVYGCEP